MTERAEAGAPAGEPAGDFEGMRLVEALLFAATEPLDEETIAARLPPGADVPSLIEAVRQRYASRGVVLRRTEGRWAFRTAPDLDWLFAPQAVEPRKMSRATLETLAIIAYHQPVTRAEIEDIRGVSMSKGMLDVLMEIGWIRMRGRRRAPGRPVTYGTTLAFLDHFGLEALSDLPGLDELKGAGLLDNRLPPGFAVPVPSDDGILAPDEDPLDPADLSMAFPRPEDE